MNCISFCRFLALVVLVASSGPLSADVVIYDSFLYSGGSAMTQSSNGWYRDANSNGFLEASDRRTQSGFSSVMMVINTTAVPEPSSAVVIMFGVTLLSLSRRR